ncbi:MULTISPECIES: hypothetical protein [Proteus]|uniref:hypothetical protein n=1 Tax=Proteus TaxID=583 RepID=UPI0018E87D65|nr:MULTISPECIES: hypothetical protein [Proteus]MBJ2108362.1 hypothetical protein [Proteus terrae]
MKAIVSTDGKIISDSGILHSTIMNNMSTINFNYDGLLINLTTTIINSSYSNVTPNVAQNFTASVENGIVILRQTCFINETLTPSIGNVGMLVPIEVGTKVDGKRIFLSWNSSVMKTVGCVYVLTSTYTFYEASM